MKVHRNLLTVIMDGEAEVRILMLILTLIQIQIQAQEINGIPLMRVKLVFIIR